MSINSNGYSQRGWNGVNATVTPNPGGIYMESGTLQMPEWTYIGFKPEQFAEPLQFCPINPKQIKASETFNPKNYESLGLQDCKAFPGADADKPDDTYYFLRGVAAHQMPPCRFSGKMRLFMQCLYGAYDKKGLKRNLNITLTGQNDESSTLGSVKLGDFTLSPEVILYTDSVNYRYFLISPSFYSALIAEVVFDKGGEKLLGRLRSGEVSFSDISQQKVEGFLFSCAKDIKDVKLIEGQFDVRALGSPLAHRWNANTSGSKAIMAHVIVGGSNLKSCVSTLSINLISQVNPQETNSWTDTWTFSVTTTPQVTWNPHRSTNIIWVGMENIVVGQVPVAATAAPVYAWFKGDTATIETFTYTTPKSETVDSGWTPPSRKPYFWGEWCGMVNASKKVESRSGYNEAGFGGKLAQNGTVYVTEYKHTSSHQGDVWDGGNIESDSCSGTSFSVKTDYYGNHPIKRSFARGYLVSQSRTEARSGAAFIYISEHDPECCFTGVRQQVNITSPSTTTSTGTYYYKLEHHDYDNTQPDGRGGTVFVGYTLNSASLGTTGTTVVGTPSLTITRSAVCNLLSGSVGVGTEAHSGLYTANFTTGVGATGFAGFVNQSALTGKAIYSTESTLAGNFEICGGIGLSMSHRFIGNA